MKNKRICTNLTNININGNYETMVNFKDLPPFKKLRKEGRQWNTIKNYSPVLERLVLDIDDKNLNNALKTTRRILQNELIEYVPYINIYFSGNKGFHIEIQTDELNIIDIGAKSAGDSCIPYKEFLNYFNNKYPDVDTKIHDAGARILRKHHTKHEKSGNYKILIDINAGCDEILDYAKNNKDMVEPCKSQLNEKQALNLLERYNLPVKTKKDNGKFVNTPISNTVYSDVFNALLACGLGRHQAIGLLGASLNGYITINELEAVYQELVQYTSIEESINNYQSLIDAFESDKVPCNMGQLFNAFKANESIDFTPIKALSDYLEDKMEKDAYNQFMNMLKSYDRDVLELLKNELWDYVDNTENIFKGIIHCVGGLMGLCRRILTVNGGSESGKSEYQETLGKLHPNYEYLGSSTPASMRNETDPKAFDKKIVGLSDKGLESTSENNANEMNETYAFFGQLVTDGKYRRNLMNGKEKDENYQEVDGLILIFTQPYTNTHIFKAGEQIETRTTYITVNPVKNPETLVLLKKHRGENQFYELHKKYVEYIIKNPINTSIPDEIDLYILKQCNNSLRTFYYMMDLFNAYCLYLQIPEPSIKDAYKFMEVFKPNFDVNDIELEVLDMLRRNLISADPDKIADDGYLVWNVNCAELVPNREDMVTQVKDRATKTLFTPRQIKTYFRTNFKMNKNLKDVIDNISEILYNLCNAGYLGMLEQKYKGENVYYIIGE